MYIRGEIAIPAPKAVTWERLADIASHVEWMADAESITFTSDRREGVGTTFDCRTKVGPLTTIDKMRVTEWDDENRLGVSHTGIVTGTGVFELVDTGAATSKLCWTEDLRFPKFLGGVVGAFVAKPVLRRIWRGNLTRFAELCARTYRDER